MRLSASLSGVDPLQERQLGSIHYKHFTYAERFFSGGPMNKEKTGGKTKKKPPKVRSYVRPTRVHTPKPKKKPKHPDREIHEELDDSRDG
jgi:hypothetical protein